MSSDLKSVKDKFSITQHTHTVINDKLASEAQYKADRSCSFVPLDSKLRHKQTEKVPQAAMTTQLSQLDTHTVTGSSDS